MKTTDYFKIEYETIRLMPYNYWVATITPSGLVFNSWDGMTKKLFNDGSITEKQITEFYNQNKKAL